MEQDPFNNSNTEKLPEFLYTDNSESAHGAVIFRCLAKSIEDADKMFKEKMNYEPRINSNIGCVVDAPVNEEWRKGK